MKFVMIECLDCSGFKFAIPKAEFYWFENEFGKVSEFSCPSCNNQIWQQDTNVLGSFDYEV
jgi:hypothetical protein